MLTASQYVLYDIRQGILRQKLNRFRQKLSDWGSLSDPRIQPSVVQLGEQSQVKPEMKAQGQLCSQVVNSLLDAERHL